MMFPYQYIIGFVNMAFVVKTLFCLPTTEISFLVGVFGFKKCINVCLCIHIHCTHTFPKAVLTIICLFIIIEVPSTEVNMPAVDLAPQTIIAIGVVVSTASVLLILTIIILVLLIIYLWRKTSEITANLNQPNESDNSPPSKRKGHSSPKTKPSPLRSNGVSHIVELDNYDVEPRRAGSQPPEPSDFSASIRTMESSLKV